MKRLITLASLLFMGMLVGCGGEPVAAPASSQDELAKYAAENPSPPEIPVD